MDEEGIVVTDEMKLVLENLKYRDDYDWYDEDDGNTHEELFEVGASDGSLVELDAGCLRSAINRYFVDKWEAVSLIVVDGVEMPKDPSPSDPDWRDECRIEFTGPVSLYGDASDLFGTMFPSGACCDYNFSFDDSLTLLDTKGVTNMDYAFVGCVGDLNLSNFDMSNVERANRMFGWCNGLKSLTVPSRGWGSVPVSSIFENSHMESLERVDGMRLSAKDGTSMMVSISGDSEALSDVLVGNSVDDTVTVSWESHGRYKSGSMDMSVRKVLSLSDVADDKSLDRPAPSVDVRANEKSGASFDSPEI